jgi:CheY-like chemotaxis protein
MESSVMDANDQPVILFVEDNPLANKLGIMILEDLNCRVDTATSGAKAIKYASQNVYSIVFMDIGLPDICGIKVIENIRHGKLNKNVPIVALTAHSDKDYVKECYDLGASEFLVKPLSNDIARELLKKYFIKSA